MHSTKAVEVNIQATSPLFGVGAGAAAASGAFAASAAGAGAASFFCSAAGACARDSVGATTAPRANAATDASTTIHFFILFPLLIRLERFFAGLAGADAHDLFEVVDEYLSVADLAGTG